MAKDTLAKNTICLLFLLLGSVLLSACAEMAYRHMNDPSRDVWQKPTEVIERLAITPGSRIADLGAGGGYFTWYLASAVGPSGTVYAVDVDDTALEILKKETRSRGLLTVKPIHATLHDANLPEPVDLVFSCDTYHHMKNREAYFRSLQQYLKPNGQVAILDFHPRGFFSGLLRHGTAKEDVRREMEASGYRLVADHHVIESQHFQIFSRANP